MQIILLISAHFKPCLSFEQYITCTQISSNCSVINLQDYTVDPEDTGAQTQVSTNTTAFEQTLNTSDPTFELSNNAIPVSHSILSTSGPRAGSISRTLTFQLYLAAVGGSNSSGHGASLLTSHEQYSAGLLLFMLQSEDTQVGRLYLYPNHTQDTFSF